MTDTAKAKTKGQFTFRFTAVCFGISAISELFSLQDSTMLFGAMVGGAGVMIYHLIYIVLFAWLTIGLWKGSRSGYYVLIATTVFYTADRLQLLLVGNALKITLRQELAGTEGMLPAGDMNYILQVLSISIIAFIACWWSFVVYAYFRRSYFGIR